MENTLQGKPHATPKDFFIHLGSIIGLYISAVSLIALLFHVINALFPDPASYQYNYSYSSGMRTAIASLIVIFPLYIWLTKITRREALERSEVADSPIRKWLTYFTLFLAGVTVAIDLIVLINTFLSGEITIRFALKVLTVLLVATGIFGYYRSDLKQTKETTATYPKMYATITSVIVALSIVGSFFIIGSPLQARNLRLDDQRMSDLQAIQWQIVNYWQLKQALPTSLDDLNDPISGFSIPRDPVTDTSYEYTATGPQTFSLCATFALDTSKIKIDRPATLGTFENWSHESGRYCFDRTIDPERYPPNSINQKIIPVRVP